MDDTSANPDWNNGYEEFWNQATIVGGDHQPSPFAMAPSIPDSSNHHINPSSNPPQNQNNKTTMFFKTRLCTKFKLGSCPYQNNCNFAHGAHELRQPPPNWQEIVAGERGGEQNKVNRNKICRSFYNGEECPYGDSCTFLHEKRSFSVRESSVVHVETNHAIQITRSDCLVLAGGGGGGGRVEQSKKSEFWKTKMCHKWEATGHCPFGENCSYAHGIEVEQPFCPFGEKFSFADRTEELNKFGGQRVVSTGNTGVACATTKLNSAAMTDQESIIQPMQEHNGVDEPQMKESKIYEKLKRLKKINGIYGDWI